MEGEIPVNSNNSGENKFQMDNRQKVVFERLSRLVGPGTADFYEDACRHMATKPPFKATTHIVGHLLRDVESAMCDVLTIVSDEKPKRNEPDAHKKKLVNILKGLGIEETEPVAVAWLNLTGKKNEGGLHKRAHRDSLEDVRPVDDDFIEFWNQMQTILEVMLDRFEAQYANIVFKKLDGLAKKDTPTSEDAKTIHSNIPNNFVAHQRFFNQLSNTKWLPLLKSEGLFLEPPEPERNYEEKTTRHPLWPAGVYLEKVASIEPEIAKEILRDIKEVDNANVKGALLKVASNLRKEDRLELLPRIKEWVKTEHHIFQMSLTDPAKNIIEKFLEDGEEDAAFEVATNLLEILPDPTQHPIPEEGSLYRPSLRPLARLDSWYYDQFFKKDFPKLIAKNKKRSFDLASDLLLSYLTHEHRDQKEEDHKFTDNSYIPRGAIEDHEQNHRHNEIEDVLIETIRDIGLEMLKENPALIETLYTELKGRKWTIFRRIGFYLLAEVSDTAPELVVRELTEESYFDVSDIEHEYSRLMRNGFKLLDEQQKAIILDWIDKAHHISESIKRIETENGPERALKSKELWQRDRLSFIKDDVTQEWKTRYDDFIKKYGEPEHPDFPAYSTSWTGPESDIHASELGDMEVDALVEYLNTWEPKSTYGFGSSKEGLGRELAGAIKLKPEKFDGIAEKFKNTDPTYVRSYIQAFVERVQNKHEIEWGPILELSSWVVQQPLLIPGRKGEIMDKDPDWGWTRKAIASLISRGTNQNVIPFELRDKVWSIIEPLTHDPDPTLEDEMKRELSHDDAYGLAINSSRSEAVGAVLEYALWVYRCIEKTPNGKEEVKSGFKIMPEVQTILDFHLLPENDPSIAVRAMYGRFFPWILLLDKGWVTKNLDKIFPPGGFNNRLYGAGWSTLLLHTPAFNEPFEILRGQYLEAAKNLGKVDKSKRRVTDKDERLAEHLMIFYGRGKIELSDPLLQEFWNTANDELREHALDFIGHSLRNEGEPDPVFLERAKLLWDSRLAVAQASKDKTEYEKEMSAFGWWFASGKFDDKWSSDQYLEALEIGRKIQSDYFVAERLGELVKTLPVESIKILDKMVLEDKPGWIVMGNRAEISSILSVALNAPEIVAQTEARNLINRLVARGHTEYNDLLK